MKRVPLCLLWTLCAAGAAECSPDVAIIGAGISGLSAALEAARAGARVTVIDQNTVGGGHAILSSGAVCIVGTPMQAAQKIVDGPALAEKDFWLAAKTPRLRGWLGT